MLNMITLPIALIKAMPEFSYILDNIDDIGLKQESEIKKEEESSLKRKIRRRSEKQNNKEQERVFIFQRSRSEDAREKYPDAIIVDITKNGPPNYRKFCATYGHYNLPVPFDDHPPKIATTLLGIWEALKVFRINDRDDVIDIDVSKLTIDNHVKIQRKPEGCTLLGWKRGTQGSRSNLLSPEEALKEIYYSTFDWIIENILEVKESYNSIKKQYDEGKVIVFLDNTKNATNPLQTISNAALLQHKLEGTWPPVPNSVKSKPKESKDNDLTIPTTPKDKDIDIDTTTLSDTNMSTLTE